MATDTGKSDLEDFYVFVGEQVKNGGEQLSPEQVVAMWRERVETVKAIQEGLEDVEAGRVRPAGEVLAELRNEWNGSEDG
ncbi:MAG: hypothetical protein ACC628_02365 [Pirellulaceae bacterium]